MAACALWTLGPWAARAADAVPHARRVLYLSSYHAGLKYSDDIFRGIRDGLGRTGPIDLLVEYMDSKRFSSPEHFRRLYQGYRSKFAGIRFDLVLASDDNALDFLRQHRDDLFPGAPVVFCGANDLTERDIAGYPGFWGISEDLGLRQGLEVGLRLHPDARRLFVVLDRTNTGRKVRQALEGPLSALAGRVEATVLDDLTVDELVLRASSAPPHSVFFFCVFYRDASGAYLDSEDVCARLCAATSAPVYGLLDTSLGRGIVGGLLASPYRQGMAAGRLAARVLAGEDTATLPRVSTVPSRYMFDHAALVRAGVGEDLLPSGSLVVNRPASFYEQYRHAVWWSAGLLVCLLGALLAMGANILQRRRVQQGLSLALGEMRSIFDNSQVGILLLRGDRRIHRANQRAAELFGYADGDEMLGHNMLELHLSRERYREFGDTHYSELARGERIQVEYQLRRRDGESLWMLLSGAAVDQAERPDMSKGVLWMVTDITERKRTEDELAALNLHLEEIVHERTSLLEEQAVQLKTANMRLTELDRMKSAFLSTVSHDLRTPLTSIRGFAQLIRRDFEHFFLPFATDQTLVKKGGRIVENLEIITEEGRRLTRLINDFLDLSKIETGRMDWRDRRLYLPDLVDLAVSSVRGEFNDRPEVELVVECEENLPAVHADGDRILQVMVNLLNNAAKFTERGCVRVRVAAPASNVVRVEVADTGVGVAAADAARIFDKFRQVDQGDTLPHTLKGSGLGLAICREIVAHYRGAIWVESEMGSGSRFFFTLPVADAAPAA
ncbi:MAG: PAS domain S-box protein [Desulfovibrionaceae bacterium]|jgi:PAS domain S-box-containing protein|nr:PAS domain S-box protein [Desulfovibrionaceae bacterium]